MFQSRSFRLVLDEEEPMWTLPEALGFTHDLIHIVKYVGFGVGLTGGILREGKSNHDIDIILYPLQSTGEHNVEAIANVKQLLSNFGLKPKYDRTSLHASWRRKGSKDEKWVEVWNFEGKRVDIFFVR